MSLLFGIVEWSGVKSKSPNLIIGMTWADVNRAVIGLIKDECGDTPAEDDPQFLAEHPYPTDMFDDRAISEWLESLRDSTTSPWYTQVSDDKIRLE